MTFSNTPVPQDFFLKDILYILIDWQALARSSRQQWHLHHEVSATSALIQREPPPWQSTEKKKTPYHLYKKKHLQKERNPPLLSLWVWESQLKDKEFWDVDSGGSIRLAVFGRCNDNASIVTAEKWFPTICIFIDAPNCK